MRIHFGRTTAALLAAMEVGATAGAALAWTYLVGRTLLWEGSLSLNQLLGAALWGVLIGAPTGAVVAPVLAFTILRRVPLGRALGLSTAGALAGMAVAASFHRGPAIPVPVMTPVLIAAGVCAGVALARRGTSAAQRRTPELHAPAG